MTELNNTGLATIKQALGLIWGLLPKDEQATFIAEYNKPKEVVTIIDSDPNAPKFLLIFRTFLNNIRDVNGLSKSTIFKHEKIFKNVSDYLHSVGLQYLQVKDFKVRTANALDVWLHNNLKSCSKTHSARHIEMIKRCLDYCVNDEVIAANPLAAYKPQRSKVKNVIAITEDEIDMLLRYPFQSDMLQIATHVYLFQCATGLSYGDLKHYRYENLSDGEWFTNSRKKNDESYYVPVFPLSKSIFNHYKGQLPIQTNGTYNRLLKEIAGVTNIKKHLTTHTARKTFATVKYSEGWSVEAISQMLGQKSVKTTETHYIKVNRRRILREKITLENNN